MVDASVKDGKSALAVVAKNSHGKLLLMACKRDNAALAELAEMEALLWTVEIVVQTNWRIIDWQSDAKFLVDQINSNDLICSNDMVSSLKSHLRAHAG